MGEYTVFLGDVALDEYYRADSWPVPGGKAFLEQMEPEHGGMMTGSLIHYTWRRLCLPTSEKIRSLT